MSASHTAKANVAQIRQTTQFTCCAASIASALHALGKNVTEDEVNRVLGAAPMAGATWEAMLATVQYFGCRGTLVVPATPRMLKEWTDRGIPVLIGWNYEQRPWSHASCVFHVEEGADGKLMVHVMDPNIPNPSQTTRIVDEDTFCQRWSEKMSDTLIMRRPAMAVELEVSPAGRQMVASKKPVAGDHENLRFKSLRAYWEYNSEAERVYGVVIESNFIAETGIGAIIYDKKSNAWIPQLGEDAPRKNLAPFTASDPREGIQKALRILYEAVVREGVLTKDGVPADTDFNTPSIKDLYRTKRYKPMKKLITRVAEAYLESDRESARRDPYKIDMSNAPAPVTRFGPDAAKLNQRKTWFQDSQAYLDSRGRGNPKHRKKLYDSE